MSCSLCAVAFSIAKCVLVYLLARRATDSMSVLLPQSLVFILRFVYFVHGLMRHSSYRIFFHHSTPWCCYFSTGVHILSHWINIFNEWIWPRVLAETKSFWDLYRELAQQQKMQKEILRHTRKQRWRWSVLTPTVRQIFVCLFINYFTLSRWVNEKKNYRRCLTF